MPRGQAFPGYIKSEIKQLSQGLADLCGIKKYLTFHLARHTFPTSVTLSNGVAMETVSKMLGHTTIPTTQIYAKVVGQKVSQDMANLRDLLNKQEKTKPTILRVTNAS